MENTMMRSVPCAECGGEMLWTQNAWKVGDVGQAAYCCRQGHAVDPTVTRQCPGCGIHDTTLLTDQDGHQQFSCSRCGKNFEWPR